MERHFARVPSLSLKLLAGRSRQSKAYPKKGITKYSLPGWKKKSLSVGIVSPVRLCQRLHCSQATRSHQTKKSTQLWQMSFAAVVPINAFVEQFIVFQRKEGCLEPKAHPP
jgi:hypothetical protein